MTNTIGIFDKARAEANAAIALPTIDNLDLGDGRVLMITMWEPSVQVIRGGPYTVKVTGYVVNAEAR